MASTYQGGTDVAQPRRGRRFNGEGTVYRDGDGWRAALLLPGHTTPLRQRAASEDEAYKKLEAMRMRAGLGLPPPSADQLKVFLRWWLDVQEAKAQSGVKSTNTVDNARWAVDTWIVPALGNKRLRELEPEDVEGLLATMATAEVDELGNVVRPAMARSSLIRIRSFLGQALAVAEKRGKVARNVARIAEIPATRTPPRARRSLTPEQAEKLLAAVQGDRLEALWITGLMLGLRPGELTGLRWDDLANGTLYVDVSLQQRRTGPPGTKRTLVIGDTKTARSRRPLKLPPPVSVALKAHRRAQKRERLIAGPEWEDTGLVFTTPIGTPLDPSNLRHTFQKLTDKAGIGRWSPNELRHSAASLMSAAGVPLEVIADVLGHTSTRMLERHYRHRTRPVIDGHVAVMDGLFGTGAAR